MAAPTPTKKAPTTLGRIAEIIRNRLIHSILPDHPVGRSAELEARRRFRYTPPSVQSHCRVEKEIES